MNAPPRAKTEYSRAAGASGGVSGARERRISRRFGGAGGGPFGRLGAAIFAGTLLAAAMLIAAEFTTLYRLRITTSQIPLSSEGTGPHDSYALIPIAVLVIVLAIAVLRAGSRPALLAIGIAGLVALLISLLGDLPDVNTSNPIIAPNGNYVNAGTIPGPGMYLETAGAILLIAVTGFGFLLLGGPQAPRPRTGEIPAAQDDPSTEGPQSGS